VRNPSAVSRRAVPRPAALRRHPNLPPIAGDAWPRLRSWPSIALV